MDHLDQAVEEGDLILLYNDENAWMLLVKSAPNDEKPSTDSVIVEKAGWSLLQKQGSWVLDGPEVRYTSYEEDGNTESTVDGERGEPGWLGDFEKPLREMIDSVGCRAPLNVVVKPHGQDVLEYYFDGRCPECGRSGWICPGCGGVSTRYPDIFGGCGVDQSCPICMGYDFALDDKVILREIERIEDYISFPKRKGSRNDLPDLWEEALGLLRERYSDINARRGEMGMSLYDVADIEKEWKEYWCKE